MNILVCDNMRSVFDTRFTNVVCGFTADRLLSYHASVVYKHYAEIKKLGYSCVIRERSDSQGSGGGADEWQMLGCEMFKYFQSGMEIQNELILPKNIRVALRKYVLTMLKKENDYVCFRYRQKELRAKKR